MSPPLVLVERIDAFTVPKAFWSQFVTLNDFCTFVTTNGRLMEHEREHLWQIMGRRGRPPRSIHLILPEDLLRRIGHHSDPMFKGRCQWLNSALRTGCASASAMPPVVVEEEAVG